MPQCHEDHDSHCQSYYLVAEWNSLCDTRHHHPLNKLSTVCLMFINQLYRVWRKVKITLEHSLFETTAVRFFGKTYKKFNSPFKGTCTYKVFFIWNLKDNKKIIFSMFAHYLRTSDFKWRVAFYSQWKILKYTECSFFLFTKL